MDKGTFGKSPAAVRLAEILDELNSSKVTGKVTKFLVNYNRNNAEVRKSKDLTNLTKNSLLTMIYHQAVKSAKVMFEGKVQSFILNLIAATNKEITAQAIKTRKEERSIYKHI